MIAQHTCSTEVNTFRVKTLATRVTTTELLAIEAAAKVGGITCSEWLRNVALANLDLPTPTLRPSLETTILAEVMALRYLVVNLSAAANSGFTLQTLYDAMKVADQEKHGAASRVLTSPGENPTP
jgi:hypothetical protein